MYSRVVPTFKNFLIKPWLSREARPRKTEVFYFMAEGKKSFVLYCDLIHTVNKLSNEDAGELFRQILLYVNDENPATENKLVDVVFEGIKQTLKRDLVKYEQRAERSRENGAKGGRPKKPKKPSGLKENPEEPKKPDSVSGSDNDSGNEIFNFKKELIKLGCEQRYIDDWLVVRKKKKGVNSETALEGWIKQVDKSNLSYNDAVRVCAENSWVGFNVDWLPNVGESQTKNHKQQNEVPNSMLPNMEYIKEKMKIVEEYERKNK